MQTTKPLSAETLGQIALIQGMVAHLPDQKSILSFVCRGLEIVPGTKQVDYRIFEQEAAEEGLPKEPQKPVDCFPLEFRGLVYGEVSFKVSDPDLFTPYIPYLENLSHMLGVIFEERRQRSLNEAYKDELEQRVFERTQQLEKEINGHKRSQKLLDSIINNTRNVIYVKDLAGRFTLVNNRFCEIVQFDRDRIIGRLPIDIFPETVAVQHLENDRVVVAKKEAVTFNEYAELPDGRHEYISIKFPLFNKAGSVSAVGGISTDITELKDLEKKLRQAYKMESIGTLAGGIAHDFNNILSAIFGYTELSLAETKPGTVVHGSLRSVLKASERARDLVRHILAFGRQGEQEFMSVELTPVVKEVLKFMRASLPTSIEIRQKLKGTPAVLADPTQIHQVIMNLCTNAGQAMHDKSGILEVGLEMMELDSEFTGRYPGLQPGAHIKLTVSDTGHGISSELAERIFDPFFTTKERGEGTGMGLSVVHGIVKSHGGIITVYSNPGKGSIFIIFLPAIERGPEQDIMPEKALTGGTESILFIDDEKPLVKLGESMLGAFGYKVTGVSSSTEALERFRQNPDQFDLIITDLTMPNITGDRLAKEFLKIKPDIPIILCTGFSASIDENTAIAMGMRAFVKKPILRRHISETIRKVLDSEEASV
ncbi:MAG: response regulator [bacterium]|nr:response regulator [bacterium]